MKSVSLVVPFAVATSLSACAQEMPPQPRSPVAEAKLARELAGKVPGAPQTCIQPYQSSETITIDDNTILFKRGSTVYRNDPPGGCASLGTGFYTLVTRSSGSGLCRGDIAHVADISNGMVVGSCSLSDFVPYTPPR